MTVEHIIFFPNTLSQYDALTHFTEGLMSAFKRIGIHCELVIPNKKDILPFLTRIYVDQPDFTLSFNGLLPNEKGEFLADVINVPHVCCLVDSAHFFESLKASPLNIITCPDRTSCSLFQAMKVKHTFFLPHAVSKEVLESTETYPALYDVVFLGSGIDYLAILEKWKLKYEPKLVKTLQDCAEAVLEDPALPYQTALLASCNPENFEEKEYIQLLNDLDLYLRGKDRIQLIKSIKSCKVDIFGSSIGLRSWRELLGAVGANVRIHDPVSYKDSLQIMRKSKVVLNSSPMFKHGGHERIFTGLACNALVLTNETSYMLENFDHGKELLLYRAHHMDAIDGMLLPYLKNEKLRQQLVEAGKQKVALYHTWDHRAKELIAQVEPILESLSEL